eukprot:TRINITY_DN1983_c0_g1_i1.p1 TRINITY_DN1983_c0_g1~~TRINITY_DN1983_c0_g1_i1.p1  ORF type:complete len:700 (-),score=75.98 TRINITY_DN1983_c0_g1_i1:200-2299(-)
MKMTAMMCSSRFFGLISLLWTQNQVAALVVSQQQIPPNYRVPKAKLPVTTGTVRCTDSNSGSGFIMYSYQDVNQRWRTDPHQDDFREHTAKNFVCVRFRSGRWEYDNNWADEPERRSNASWNAFQLLPTDIMVANVDYSLDTVANLNYTNIKRTGVQLGYHSGDLIFYPNQDGNGQMDQGEFRITGTYFVPWTFPLFVPATTRTTTQTAPVSMIPNTASVRIMSGGLRCTDNATGSGFIMYSNEDVHKRFNHDKFQDDFREHGANSFVCVRYNDNQWQFDTNWADETDRRSNNSWHTFIPRTSDTLVASVDYTDDKVMDLKGINVTHKGIQMGYADGDLVFFANQNATAGQDDGEFRITGSYIVLYLPYTPPPPPVMGAFTTTSKIIAKMPPPAKLTSRFLLTAWPGRFTCRDSNKGAGFIMYSKEEVHTRFGGVISLLFGNKNTARNFVCVRYKDNQWQYEDNWSKKAKSVWNGFTPLSSDIAVASVDWTTNKLTNMKSTNMFHMGLQMGYAYGDLKFHPLRKGSNSKVLFEMKGTFIVGYADKTVVNPHTSTTTSKIPWPHPLVYAPPPPPHNHANFMLSMKPAVIDCGKPTSGHGLVMFLGKQSRFVCVRFVSPYWEFWKNKRWNRFVPHPNDIGVATVDYRTNAVKDMKGYGTKYYGLQIGYSGGDVAVRRKRNTAVITGSQIVPYFGTQPHLLR